MFVKICGLTTLADTQAAINAGADFLGFNFYPKSPRCLTPENCAAITTSITNHPLPLTFVGIFVNEPRDTIQHIMQRCGLHLAQLHGDESPDFVAQFGGRAYKAFRGLGQNQAAYAKSVMGNSQLPITNYPTPQLPAFLIDSPSPGSGQVTDWAAARTIAAQYPVFLAGGLTPANVSAAIAQVQPWGVDVASGVEAGPGRKDAEKMRLFVERAKSHKSFGEVGR